MCDALTWLPAWQIRELIGKREVSCRGVLEHFLGRIEQFDTTLYAFAELDLEGARAQADRADRAVKVGEPLGLLHGLPTSVKRHIHVRGMLLTPLRFVLAPEARLPCGLGAVRLRRRPVGGAPVRELARPRGRGAAGGGGLPARTAR